MSIKMHPRTQVVNASAAIIRKVVNDTAVDNELTYPEILYILAEITHGYAADGLKAERREATNG